jgi:glutathione S-transferase
MALSLTTRLREVLALKASQVQEAKEYCEQAGLTPSKATVLDCLVHCQLYWSFHGSAPHIQQIWDRIDGRTAVKAEVKVDGKLGVSEAIAAMKLGMEDEDE